MIRGIQISASGLLLEQKRADIAANNVANANTTGFKKERVSTSSFPEMLLERIGGGEAMPIGSSGLGAETLATTVDRTQGALQATGNPLDLAITGPGFFVLETPQGERYTRRGNFRRDASGYLVTEQGYRVLGETGPLQLSGDRPVVDKQGRLGGAGNSQALRIVDFTLTPGSADRLVPEGDSLYRLVGGAAPVPARGYQVHQGFLEASNVNPINEMVALITIMRGFEANQKAVQAQDETLDKAVNELGRVK